MNSFTGNWFSDEIYNPVQAGSIDGTDTIPHDHAILRASRAYYDPDTDPKITNDPYKTLFVGRLNLETNEEKLQQIFSQYGKIVHLRLARDIVTGMSKGYAFITYEHAQDFMQAFKNAHHMVIDDKQIIIDFERERVVDGWIPRRYGGGIGGKKESGQIRFGGRERPFKKPILKPIPSIAFQRFDFRRDLDRFAGKEYIRRSERKLLNREDKQLEKKEKEANREKSPEHKRHHESDDKSRHRRSRSRDRKERERKREREHEKDKSRDKKRRSRSRSGSREREKRSKYDSNSKHARN